MTRPVCTKCNSTMHLARTLNSGNSTFETWQCDNCDHHIQKCTGINL